MCCASALPRCRTASDDAKIVISLRISLTQKSWDESVEFWCEIREYRIYNINEAALPIRESLFLDFLYRRASTLSTKHGIGLFLLDEFGTTRSYSDSTLFAVSTWPTVELFYCGFPLTPEALYACASRWKALKELRLPWGQVVDFDLVDCHPFQRLEALHLGSGTQLPTRTRADGISGMTKLKALTLPAAAVLSELDGDALGRVLHALSPILPPGLTLCNISFSFRVPCSLLGLAVQSAAPLSVVCAIADALCPHANLVDNPIFRACEHAVDDECARALCAEFVARGCSVDNAWGTVENEKLHAVFVCLARGFFDTFLYLKEALSRGLTAEILYSSAGATPFSSVMSHHRNITLLLEHIGCMVDLDAATTSGTTGLITAICNEDFDGAALLCARGATSLFVPLATPSFTYMLGAWLNGLQSCQLCSPQDAFDCFIDRLSAHVDVVTASDLFSYAGQIFDSFRQLARFIDTQTTLPVEVIFDSIRNRLRSEHQLSLISALCSISQNVPSMALFSTLLAGIDHFPLHLVSSLIAFDATSQRRQALKFAVLGRLNQLGLLFVPELFRAVVSRDLSLILPFLLEKSLHCTLSDEWIAFLVAVVHGPDALANLELWLSGQDAPESGTMISDLKAIASTRPRGSHWREAFCLGVVNTHKYYNIPTLRAIASRFSKLLGALNLNWIERFYEVDAAQPSLPAIAEVISAINLTAACRLFDPLHDRGFVDIVSSLPSSIQLEPLGATVDQFALHRLFALQLRAGRLDEHALDWFFETGLDATKTWPESGGISLLQVASADELVLLGLLSRLPSASAAALVQHRDWYGRTVLHDAVRSALSYHATDSRVLLIQRLLELGADPLASDVIGESPLSYPIKPPLMSQKAQIVNALQTAGGVTTDD